MYLPEKKSLALHRVPDWYHDAKLGIFIHWGLYSIPAFAVTEYGDITQTMKHGLEFHFTNNPYAEWYLNSLRIEGSPTQDYHRRHYGSRPYHDFAADFNAALQGWNPADWAKFFRNVGARYVVLTTKHHDGFLLYPSRHPNPNHPDYHAVRDIPLELKTALTEESLRFGTYYSGALDWTFTPTAITDAVDLITNGSPSAEYGAYVDAHFHELIERYDPDVLWNDIGYPPMGNPAAVIADFYNHNEEGVVNDRWSVSGKRLRKLLQWKPIRQVINNMAMKMILKGESAAPGSGHFDFRTPEYQQLAEATTYQWEACQGLGYSFGYNRMDDAETYLSSERLIHLFIDIVSKNGNLLINVGPDDQAQIPSAQQERLLALGEWLAVHGEAIYATRPWIMAEARTMEGIELRFTQKAGAVYLLSLGTLPAHFTVPGLTLTGTTFAHRLEDQAVFTLRNTPEGVHFSTTADMRPSPANVIRIQPAQVLDAVPTGRNPG